jgi:hypothetical protein
MPPTLRDLEDSLENMRDDLESMASTLSKGLRDSLSDALTDLNNMAEALKEGKDITKDLASKTAQYQKQSNKLALDQISLEAQLLKAVQDRNYAAQQKIDKQLTENRFAQEQIEKQLDAVKLLGQQAQEEKKVTEEKKKQNNLADLIDKKYKDIKDTLKGWFALGSIIDMLFKGSENIANFRKELGISYENAYLLNNELGFVGNNVFDAYINGEKLKKSFTDLSKEMGFIVDYGNESLVTMTNLTGRLGMSSKEAAQLTTLARMQSTDTEAVLDNVGKTVTAMNKQGKTAILLKDVMREVATVSKATAVSLGSNPVKIAEAVMAAKQLGTTLQQMESTADSLLNFESSISNELNAELLTGKQMNLERARAAALANDMKSLSEEIGKNEEVIGAFASGNRLAQEATAKALGMNREQLASMIYQQEALKIGAEGVRAKYGEQAYEQLKAQNAQEKFANSIEKLKTALSSVVQIFSPLIDLLATASEFMANILSQWYIFYPLVGLVALSYLPKMASSFANIGKSITGVGTNFKNLFSKEGRASLMGGVDKTKETAEKTAEAGKKGGVGGPKAGDGIKSTLKGISAGIQSFSKVSPADIAKLAFSALALVAFTPAIPALLALQFVNGKLIQGALEGTGKGLAAFGKAVSKAAPEILIGEALLAGLGLALWAFVPIVKAVGDAIATIVTSIAGGISTIVGSLGDMISKLGEAGPALLLLGPALFGIAGGLAAMGLSGILALPSIIALTALGAVAPALADIGIGGRGGKGEEGKGTEMTELIAAVKEVKAAVDKLYSKDTSINMDGKKVGTTLVQGSYKVA